MRPVMPTVHVPGDNEREIAPFQIAPFNQAGALFTVRPNIMARSGELRGFNRRHAVWCFGFLPDSEAANAYSVSIAEDATYHGFLWVLATLRTGAVTTAFRGYAVDLPAEFVRVLEANVLDDYHGDGDDRPPEDWKR